MFQHSKTSRPYSVGGNGVCFADTLKVVVCHPWPLILSPSKSSYKGALFLFQTYCHYYFYYFKKGRILQMQMMSFTVKRTTFIMKLCFDWLSMRSHDPLSQTWLSHRHTVPCPWRSFHNEELSQADQCGDSHKFHLSAWRKSKSATHQWSCSRARCSVKHDHAVKTLQ